MKILMTGSREGLGGYLREKFEEQGHEVYGVGLSQLEEEPVDFRSLSAGELDNMSPVFDRISPDVLINHAGMTHIEWSHFHPVQKFSDIMHVNCTVPFAFCKQMIRLTMEDRQPRRVLNVGSMASRMGLRACPAYGASKAALETMTRSLAKECGEKCPVSFFALGPGGIEDTGMIRYAIQRLQETRGMTEAEALAYNQQGGLGRYARWEEIWTMYDFIVNKAPVFATGSVWHLSNATGL